LSPIYLDENNRKGSKWYNKHMKTLLLACTFVLSASVFADDRNQYQYEEGFDGSQALTDEEVIESREYIHEGQAQRIGTEACSNITTGDDGKSYATYTDEDGNEQTIELKKGNEDLCTNTEFAFSSDGWRKVEALAPIASQMFSVFFAAGGDISVKVKNDSGPNAYDKDAGGGLSASQRKQEADESLKAGGDGYETKNTDKYAKDENGKNETEKKTDVCGKIPPITEMAAGVMQQMDIGKIEKNLDEAPQKSKQADSFYALADTHKQRKKAADVQKYGWGATSGCYILYSTVGGANFDTFKDAASMIAKTTASTLLAVFYTAKAKGHQELYDSIKGLADALPAVGDCNPHTNQSCFCAESTSAMQDPTNFQKYCLPKQYGDNTNASPTVCVDGNGQVDRECKCAKSNSCIDEKLSLMGAKVGIPSNLMRNPLNGLSPLSKGFMSADLSGTQASNMAMAKKGLNRMLKNTTLPKFKLRDDQKKIANDLMKFGIPAKAAAITASQVSANPNLASVPASIRNPGSFAFNNRGLKNAKKRVGKVGYGSANGKSKRRGKRRSKTTNPFSKFAFGKKKVKEDNGVVIDDSFAHRKAAGQATINRNTGRPIFEIISYRYKVSAWKQFEDKLEEESNKK
jgi:hypothetical protein